MHRNVILLAALLAAVPAAAQMPDGSDIPYAIPIYFGQTVSDIIDASTKPIQVYSIALGRGQKFTATATLTSGSPNWALCLFSPDTKVVARNGCTGVAAGTNWSNATSLAVEYTVATAGTYYVQVLTRTVGTNYRLVVSAQGTVVGTPNPSVAGCITGQVDYMTYSQQMIAVDLPDEISVGGVVACATCQIKAPLYADIVRKMESSLRANVPISACYDPNGNIFQIKVMHQ